MNQGITKLKAVAKRIKLMNELQIVSRNSTHYRLSIDLAEHLNTKRIIKKNTIDLTEFKVIFIDSCRNELIHTEQFLT